MQITNEAQILENAGSEVYRKLRSDALDILKTAVDAVDPERAVKRCLRLKDGSLHIDSTVLDLDEFDRVFVVGGGKAGGAMAKALEEILGERITSGVVNVLKGTEDDLHLDRIELNGASHPVPDEGGINGVGRMLSLLEDVGGDDLVISLISGGGSAMMTYPAPGIKLGEIQSITGKLLRSGATINELNAVRKHLSAFKGGQLAKRCYPARVLSLILSDVVGDPLDTIASGPTAPDESTFREAVDVLKKYCLWDSAAEPVKRRLEEGLKGLIEETPKKGDKAFEKVTNFIVGNNSIASERAVERAEALGYNSLLLSTMIEGEARHVGTVCAGIAREIHASGRPITPPAAVVLGGETTVTVKGRGKGGRNQELALNAAIGIRGLKAALAALATDGIDGPTDAAGAIADGMTYEKASFMNMSVDRHLYKNDSYSFFKSLGDLIITGPTGTNVDDIILILVADQR